MQDPAPILLVCYKFPPFKGIGGRRWAKFAKELARRGHHVHVVTCEPATEDLGSLWDRDVNDPMIHVYHLPRRHPRVLSRKPLRGLMDKLAYRAWWGLLPLVTKGDPLDRAVFWRDPLLRLCRELIHAHGIRNVLATAAPFRLLAHVAELKDIPGLHLAADLRDPWTWDAGYGWKMLTPRQQREEQAIEAATLHAFDRICAPTLEFLSGMCERYPALEGHSIHIPHAIDPDDLQASGALQGTTVAPVIFAGSFYDKEATTGFVAELIRGVAAYCARFPQEAGKAIVELYITSGRPVEAMAQVEAAGLADRIRFLDPIAVKALGERSRHCRFALSFHPPKRNNFVPTKFYELMYHRVPVLHVGTAGATCRFLSDHGLGNCIAVEELAWELPRYLAGEMAMPPPAAEAAWPFLLERLTDRLLREVLLMHPPG